MEHEERPAPVTAADHMREISRSMTERDENARVPYDVADPDPALKYFIAIANKAGAPRSGDVASMEALGWRRSTKPLPSGYGLDHVVMEIERQP